MWKILAFVRMFCHQNGCKKDVETHCVLIFKYYIYFQTTVERKLINILDAVETLSSNIAKKKISLLRRTYRSVQNYSIHDRINVSHENLGKYDLVRLI